MYGQCRAEGSELEQERDTLQSHWDQDKKFDHQLKTSSENYAEKQCRLDKKLGEDLDAIKAQYEQTQVSQEKRIKAVDLRASKLRSMTVYNPAERGLENAKKTYYEQLEKIKRKTAN